MSYNNDVLDAAFIGFGAGAIIVGLISGVSCGNLGAKWRGEDYQEAAIKRGYARMVMVDSISGETKFFWNDSIPVIK